jgi:cytochrome c oxidase subunit IV
MSDQHAPHTADPHAHGDSHAAHEAHPHVNYWHIFYALCLLTLASVIADVYGHALGKVVIGLVVLTVACFKAMFVMLYFMHLKYEGKWKIVLLAPTTILALAIIAALMPDIGSHYYDVRVPQVDSAAANASHHAARSHDGVKGHEGEKPAGEQ